MYGRGTKLAGFAAALVTALSLTGVAGAKTTVAPKFEETKITIQDKAVQGEQGKDERTGDRLDRGRDKLEMVESRTRAIEEKTRSLRGDLETQRKAEVDSRDRLEESIRAAYRGEDIAGVTLVLDSMLSGDATKFNAILGGSVGKVLTRGRDSIRFRQDSQRALKDTIRQLDQKKRQYEESRAVQSDRIEDPQRGGLVVTIGGSRTKKQQTEDRIAELEAADAAGEFTRPPASGSGGDGSVQVERELEIAEEDIVALPVEPIPYERYVQIYKASAKRYGFEQDWYVLAAVGKIESNHGENMGPSSAGAIGPMQFLPSTWTAYQVDGNKDGVANIMDPEDAIPAAAAYLKDGGAPDDWQAALYAYNHAGWYVREVLNMAEGYRQLENDDEVEPYA